MAGRSAVTRKRTAADGPVLVDRHMADLAGLARDTPIQDAVDDDARTDAVSHLDVRRHARAPRAAPERA